MNKAGRACLRSVRPILAPTQFGDPEPAGSSVLIWLRDERFLISAAHVLEKGIDATLYVGTETTWLELPHPYHFTKLPPSGSRDDDALDIGFVHLPRDIAEHLDGCSFLNASQVDEVEQPVFRPGHRSLYLTVGYPINRFKFMWPTMTSQAGNLGYVGTPASPPAYSFLQLDLRTHLLLDFDRDASVSAAGLGQAPKLVGMSGGGIFRFESLRTRDPADDRLVALTIEVNEPHRVIVGTRIASIFHGIMTHHFRS